MSFKDKHWVEIWVATFTVTYGLLLFVGVKVFAVINDDERPVIHYSEVRPPEVQPGPPIPTSRPGYPIERWDKARDAKAAPK